jgi:hypothetical protein
MRARTFGLGIICGLSLAVVPILSISYFRSVYPTPDTQSVFFRSYNPQALIQRFACGNVIAVSQGRSGSAGTGFVSHQSSISAKIEIDEDHWIPLMQALALDVKQATPSRGQFQNWCRYRHGISLLLSRREELRYGDYSAVSARRLDNPDELSSTSRLYAGFGEHLS